MALFSNRNEAMRPKHLNPDSVEFSMFTTEEIKQFSVIKICSSVTFDVLGHPLPGGLYDKRLGPMSERGDPCGTCLKSIYFCPGHFGYIELPLAVVNPLFVKIIATILKVTCFSCYYIQIPANLKHSLSIQIKLLKAGLLTEASEVENRITELIAQYESFENIPEDDISFIKDFENVEVTTLGEKGRVILNKNIEGLRNQIIKNVLSQLTTRKACMHCKQPLNKLKSVRGKFFMSANKHASTEDTNESKKKSRLSQGVYAFETKNLNAEDLRKHMRALWHNEKELLMEIVPVLCNINSENPTDIFFFEVIPVPPPNIRPVNVVAGRMTENRQCTLYKNVIDNAMLLRTIVQVVKSHGDVTVLPDIARAAYTVAKGASPTEKMYFAWDTLQSDVNNIVDCDERISHGEQGLKQIIEKKAGIIRMHMMGKRVNFAARSVITPDPNLNIDEIGVPDEFAKCLTYPVPVTTWNVEELRKMILNGPNVHPGAVMVEFEDGSISRINSKNPTHQESVLKRLLTPDDGNKGFKGVKTVHRHLCNGDILLLNRQPTLHKPSIMAHTARILKGEKTLRLHYANCKAYNADFDGDEMNAHFPQNELARSEGYTLANVSNQYLVPKDGTPLSGLIQDHMIAGVRMSVRGKFFSKIDYQQMVFQALSYKTTEIVLLPPAILKPRCLWSGKQILSTVFINIVPKNRAPINLTSKSKISAKSWVAAPRRKWIAGGTPFKDEKDMSEAEVIIRNGELLVGVLDKTHYGATPYGLVHCIYELYGGSYATRLLSSLAKLFTCYLQRDGFTLGVHDILVTPKADKKRLKIIEESRKIGRTTITTALDLPVDTDLETIVQKIEESSIGNPKFRTLIDRQYKSSLDSYTNDINKACLPAGLICKFPHNNLQLMVESGAKGSTVNTMQISCLLGQIELEGKRPPIMISGKSLPSFPAFEFSPRAGGFIDGRFMTGIQPQEFFFHCMAGREGLIDTAVKTSRSGYLQRCLIKHLEGITVAYDLTVRDSDKSVLQFYYGEDGMDITRAQFLNSEQLRFLAENSKAIIDKDTVRKLKAGDDYALVEKHMEDLQKWKENFGDPDNKKHKSAFTLFSEVVGHKLDVKSPQKLSEDSGRTKKTKSILKLWRAAGIEIKNSFKEKCQQCPLPVNSLYQPDCYFGSLNERLLALMKSFQGFQKKKEKRRFAEMFQLKAMQALCAPGEPVGLLAAQSIGEPSTQMTLNTFHFAGRGDMNVTLGIPRLREILMMASKKIKTPSMEIPFLDVTNLEQQAENLRKMLTKVVVADVLEKIHVTSQLDIYPARQQRYTLQFTFLPHKLYKADYYVKPKFILKHMTKKFFAQMFNAIRKHAAVRSNLVFTGDEKTNTAKKTNDEDEVDGEDDTATEKRLEEESDSSDEEVEDPDDAKMRHKHQEVHDEQEPDEDDAIEEKLSGDENDEEEAKASAEHKGEDNRENTEEVDAVQASVVDSYHFAKNYEYDTNDHLWCKLTFVLPLNFKKIDMTAILKDVASKSVLWETPNIKRAITYLKDDKLTLRTDGINIVEMFKYNELLDLNKLYSNDIHKVAENYGIEAAAKVIVKEVQEVFKVYGIKVDPRHLLLIADYMTFNGIFEPLSRKGMESSASPLQQMSFEASLTFLKDATLKGKQDQLQSPSSCLMVGKPCKTGTGAFTLLQKIPVLGVN